MNIFSVKHDFLSSYIMIFFNVILQNIHKPFVIFIWPLLSTYDIFSFFFLTFFTFYFPYFSSLCQYSWMLSTLLKFWGGFLKKRCLAKWFDLRTKKYSKSKFDAKFVATITGFGEAKKFFWWSTSDLYSLWYPQFKIWCVRG